MRPTISCPAYPPPSSSVTRFALIQNAMRGDNFYSSRCQARPRRPDFLIIVTAIAFLSFSSYRLLVGKATLRKDADMPVSMTRTKTESDALRAGRRVLRAEAEALEQVAERLDHGFERVVEALATCNGRVVVSGVGKSADVARKIVSTFNSTGTRAMFLDATAALHGDLGAVDQDDVGLLLSHSGESEEIVRLIAPLQAMAAGLVGLTGNGCGTLARMADAALVYGSLDEADPLGLAPSTSTTVMLALGDAIAFALVESHGFTSEEFARFHPAGSLGRKLAPVDSVMRKGPALRLANIDDTVRGVFAHSSRRGRRTGAVMLLDASGRLAGLFTDSDLARLIERRSDCQLDRPIHEVMTRDPLCVSAGSGLADALEMMRRHRISELPVIESDRRPVGLLDITDLFALMPSEDEEAVRHAA
jgi:arabinose-5-phosphate isomerase